MSELSQAIERFRSLVLSRDRATATLMVRQYRASYLDISNQIDQLTRQIADLQRIGEVISRGKLHERTRLLALRNQIDQEITRFSIYADRLIVDETRTSVELALNHSQQLIRLAPGPIPDNLTIPDTFATLNSDQAQELLARFSEGSPVRSLLRELASKAAGAVEEKFVTLILQGKSPQIAARALRDDLGISLTRALTIARTETLSAYRQTTLEVYKENSDVVQRWRWVAAKSTRTCAMCLAMDGRLFDTEIPLGTHPNCRCTLAPVTPSWKDLGIDLPDRRRPGQTGREWFDKLPDRDKVKILGPAKLKEMKEGSLSLDNLVGFRDDKKWGHTRWERSLKEIREGKHKQPAKWAGAMP